MDFSSLPHAHDIPGRQDAIDHAGKIDKKSFHISTGVLFGAAMLCVLVRFTIRILKRRPIRWDDALVLFATLCFITAYGVGLSYLDALYLLEGINKKVIYPFQEDIPRIMSVSKWSYIFASMNWTAVYMVKFAFLNFFHTLTQGMPRRITVFYWTTVVISIICWLYTVVDPIIICPPNSDCTSEANHHVKSLAGNIAIAVVDIICDVLIVTLPIIILHQSMMPLSRKLSLAVMLCLSVAMIICALIRLVGTIADTRPDGGGSAPVWSTYWAVVEGCVALIMTSVIVIRGAFIAQRIQEDRKRQESIIQRFGRRLLSTLRLSGSSRSSRRSPPRPIEDQANDYPDTPRIATQGLTKATLSNLKRFVRGGGDNAESGTHQDTLKTLDTAYMLEDINYHTVRRNEAGQHAPSSSSC